jgi:hypothetical protein
MEWLWDTLGVISWWQCSECCVCIFVSYHQIHCTAWMMMRQREYQALGTWMPMLVLEVSPVLCATEARHKFHCNYPVKCQRNVTATTASLSYCSSYVTAIPQSRYVMFWPRGPQSNPENWMAMSSLREFNVWRMSSFGIQNPVHTSQETHRVTVTELNRLVLCNIWGFHRGDYEECRFLGYKTQFILHRKHIASLSQSSTG